MYVHGDAPRRLGEHYVCMAMRRAGWGNGRPVAAVACLEGMHMHARRTYARMHVCMPACGGRGVLPAAQRIK